MTAGIDSVDFSISLQVIPKPAATSREDFSDNPKIALVIVRDFHSLPRFWQLSLPDI